MKIIDLFVYLNWNVIVDKNACADDMTCCQMSNSSFGCCPYEQAACCSDKVIQLTLFWDIRMKYCVKRFIVVQMDIRVMKVEVDVFDILKLLIKSKIQK